MWRLGLLLPAFVFAALATASAGASDRAAAVQADVERALSRLARLDPSRELSYGAIEVVPDGGAYGVTVADVAVKLAANDPGLLDIGIVSFRLSPVDGDIYRVDRFAAANAFDHRGADGRVDGSWRFAPRRLAGLWSRRQGGFLQRAAIVDVSLAISGLDAAVDAVAAAPPQPGSTTGWLQLMLLRGLARRETAADGVPVDRYDIEAAGSGPLVVNGRSFRVSPAALALP
jgi:hypothetical protein